MNDIIGHENVKISFYKSIETQTLSHAHLLVGEDGIGKSLIAKDFAIKILGKSYQKQYADIIEARTEKKSIGVDYIRDLIEEINKKPYEGDKKVVVLYQGDKLTTQAQNAFLKTIEEPPKGVYIIILCEKLELILDTIRSRCQIHRLNRLSDLDMVKFLKSKYPHLKEEEIKIITAFSNGIPGRAEKFIEDKGFSEIRDITIDLLKDLSNKDIFDVLKYTDKLTAFKDNYEEVLMNILFYVRDIMIYKEMEEEKYIINQDKINEIKEIANMMSFNKLNSVVNIINETKYRLNSNVNTAMTFDVMILNMLEV